MQTTLLKIATLAIIIQLSTSFNSMAGSKEVLKKQEVTLMEEVIKNDVKQLEVLAGFDLEEAVFFYDSEGNLVFKTTLCDINSEVARKFISKSDFLAEMDGSQYFLVSKP